MTTEEKYAYWLELAQVDLLTQILGIGGKKYRGFFFEPIVFETSEIRNDNPFIREILATGKELL